MDLTTSLSGFETVQRLPHLRQLHLVATPTRKCLRDPGDAQTFEASYKRESPG